MVLVQVGSYTHNALYTLAGGLCGVVLYSLLEPTVTALTNGGSSGKTWVWQSEAFISYWYHQPTSFLKKGPSWFPWLASLSQKLFLGLSMVCPIESVLYGMPHRVGTLWVVHLYLKPRSVYFSSSLVWQTRRVRHLFFDQLWLSMEHHMWVSVIAPGLGSVNLSKFTHHPPISQITHHPPRLGYSHWEGKGGSLTIVGWFWP